MFISSINRYSSIGDFNSQNKISQYYLSINNNHISSSSLSLSSTSSNQPKNTRQTARGRNLAQRTDSLSSLSTSSITIILHALPTSNKQHRRKKVVNKNHSRYPNENSDSSSSISLPRLTNTNKTKQLLHETMLPDRKRLNIKSKHEQELSSFRCDKGKKTLFPSKNSLSNSISDFNNIVQPDAYEDEYFIRDQSTQTDNYSTIREQYPYGSLRRVNSDLLDYIFIPGSKSIR